MTSIKSIRNFSIIAHIDHGKSTLADRMLEVTETVEKRKMKDQVLDVMDLERERGITIKMQPVRMNWKYKKTGESFILNLIDTPGHIDFSYEVSRALKAVEGSILLVDSTQGVQAQTLTTLENAKAQNLTIIPVVTKIDSPLARVDEVKEDVSSLLNIDKKEILEVSGKTGEGVSDLLDIIIERISPPREQISDEFRSLIFDFRYSTHKGIILYTRVFDGSVKRGDTLHLRAIEKSFKALEIGTLSPEEKEKDKLGAGEIGYIVTGIKEPGLAFVGDTVSPPKAKLEPLSGYLNPKPVVWASVYPESQDNLNLLKQALERLRLTDSSLSYEEESSGILGKGFRCGFLGMLHLEIISERIKREFNLDVIITSPSITYKVITKNKEEVIVYSPIFFPPHGDILEIIEPWIEIRIIVPNKYLGEVMQLMYEHEAIAGETHSLSGDKSSVEASMPLRELMRNFFDDLKSRTSGYASLSYEEGVEMTADVVKLDVLIADEIVPAFSKIVSRRKVEEEAKRMVEKLYDVMPKQLFVAKIQAMAMGRIISSKTMKAMRKDVTGYLYGGDVTRKKKLLEKQKKGKKKMKERGRVNIPQDVYLKMMREE